MVTNYHVCVCVCVHEYIILTYLLTWSLSPNPLLLDNK